MRNVSAVVAGLTLGTSLVQACGFHNYAPQPTFVERLLTAENIVLARFAADNPFRFETQQTLVGDVTSADIPILVDTPTRRVMRLQPQTHVMFAQTSAEAPWERIVVVDNQTRPVVDQIVAKLSIWAEGGDIDRFSTFGGLLRHPDARVHQLALRELDRAPYAILRQLPLTVDVARLAHGMFDPQERDLLPIRALLLGLSRDPGVVPLLREGVGLFLSGDGAELGAFATALVEIQGGAGVRALVQNLQAPEVSTSGQELIVEALAMHAMRPDPFVTEEIFSNLEKVLDKQPTLAPMVARQFGSRFLWRMAPAVRAAATHLTNLDPDDQDAIGQYVAMSGG